MLTCIAKLLEISSTPLCRSEPQRPEGYGGARFEELLRLCERRNGFFAFESALHVFPIGEQCDTISFQEWNALATWKSSYGGLVDRLWFFAEDIFGDQFGVSDDSVIVFRSESGEIEQAASTLEEWACQLLIDADNLTGYQFAHRWQLENGPIASDKRLAGKLPFVLGGAYELSNVYAADRVRTMRLRGDIYRQTRELPDGARVNLRVDR